MFNPGGFLSGVFLPWVILAPAMPLLVILIRKIFFDPAIISLILLCVVTMLVNFFIFLTQDHLPFAQLFLNISLLLEFIFAALLLRTCTSNSLLQYAVITGVLVFTGVFLTLGFPGGFKNHYPHLDKACFVSLFFFSFLVLISQLHNINHRLTESHIFWISGGLFFHYGLVSLLLFLNDDIEAGGIAPDAEFGLLYTVITIIKFIFFSIGLLVYKKLDFR